MFGSNDDNQQPAQDANSMMQAAMPDPITDIAPATSVVSPSSNSPFGASAPSSDPVTGTPNLLSAPELPASGTPDLPTGQAGPVASTSDDTAAPAGNDDLINLKQQALQHLSPLVSHLDQTPEEKFRTTMMMIQASDDHSLVKSAFEAAQLITDDKARAQALLDVINEINYFTQHQS